MADEIANSLLVASTEPSVEATPSVPVETVVTETPVIETPVEKSAPETPAESTMPEIPEPAKPETLLASEKKAEESVAEIKTEETPAEVTAEPEVAPLPTFEPFTLPEGVTFDETKMGEFTKELGEFSINSKADQAEVQKLGQRMVERHVEELQRYTESLTNAWNKQKNDWKDSFLKDPEFTNRTDTVVNSAIDTIAVYGGDTKQQNEFRDLMESTGIGNHPAMIRLLSNVMLAKVEPKPLAAPQIASSAKASKISKMYGNKKA